MMNHLAQPWSLQGRMARSVNYFLTWEGIAVGAALVSAGVGAYSAVSTGENANETAKYNAKVQENAALDAQQRGAQAASEHQDKVRRMIATQSSIAASNGIQIDTGSPLSIMTDTAGMGKLDALRILNNAGREAQGLNEQAALTIVQGRNAQTAGYFNAAGQALGGLAGAASGFYKAKNPATITNNYNTII